MKFLLTSDWHRDAVTAGVARDREVDEAIGRTLQAAQQMRVDAYLMLGDLTDPDNTRSHAAVAHLVRVCGALDSFGIDSYWIPGNHDVIEDGELHHTMMVVRGLSKSNASLIDQPMVVDRGLAFLPYTPRSHTYDPDAWVRKNIRRGDVRLVCGHLNIEGITPGSETTEMARGRDVFYPDQAIQEVAPGVAMANGHYHQAQVFRGIHIPGSLCRLSFGEQDNDPGFIIMELM